MPQGLGGPALPMLATLASTSLGVEVSLCTCASSGKGGGLLAEALNCTLC
jgi:hypothetical protein